MLESILKKNKKDINFLKAYYIANKKGDGSFKRTLFVLIGEAAILILMVSFMLYKITYYKIQNEKIAQNIEKLHKIEKQLKEFQTIKGLYESKEAIYRNVLKDNQTIYDEIIELERITPSEIIFENMTLSKNKITFIIKSSKEENIAQFINNLQNSDVFANIVFNGISNQNNLKRTSITAEIVRK